MSERHEEKRRKLNAGAGPDMDLLQTTWDAYEKAWERRDRRVDDYILMKGITN